MATIEELGRTLQVLEDREAIRECLARYCYNADLGRPKEWASNFTPDGVLDTGPGTRAEGYEQLLAYISPPKGGRKTIANRGIHNITNLFIRVNGNKAWAEGYQIVLVKDTDGEARKVFKMGLSHWTFEKRNGRWFIKERVRREAGEGEWGGKVIKSYLDVNQIRDEPSNTDLTLSRPTALEALEKRIQALEDREGIRECLARYCYNADLGRSEQWADNFTPDGVLNSGPTHSVKGRAALLNIVANPNGAHKAVEGRCTDNITNLFIRVDGDEAWAEGYQIGLVREGEERRVLRMGLCHWTFKKQSGRWYIKEKVRREVGGVEWGGKVIRSYLDAK